MYQYYKDHTPKPLNDWSTEARVKILRPPVPAVSSIEARVKILEYQLYPGVKFFKFEDRRVTMIVKGRAHYNTCSFWTNMIEKISNLRTASGPSTKNLVHLRILLETFSKKRVTN